MINFTLIIRYWILDTRYWMNKIAKFIPILDIWHPRPPRLPRPVPGRDGEGEAARPPQ